MTILFIDDLLTELPTTFYLSMLINNSSSKEEYYIYIHIPLLYTMLLLYPMLLFDLELSQTKLSTTSRLLTKLTLLFFPSTESMYVRSAVVSFRQFVLRSIRSTGACTCVVPYMNWWILVLPQRRLSLTFSVLQGLDLSC